MPLNAWRRQVHVISPGASLFTKHVGRSMIAAFDLRVDAVAGLPLLDVGSRRGRAGSPGGRSGAGGGYDANWPVSSGESLITKEFSSMPIRPRCNNPILARAISS